MVMVLVMVIGSALVMSETVMGVTYDCPRCTLVIVTVTDDSSDNDGSDGDRCDLDDCHDIVHLHGDSDEGKS
jgi:hypothetical protein